MHLDSARRWSEGVLNPGQAPSQGWRNAEVLLLTYPKPSALIILPARWTRCTARCCVARPLDLGGAILPYCESTSRHSRPRAAFRGMATPHNGRFLHRVKATCDCHNSLAGHFDRRAKSGYTAWRGAEGVSLTELEPSHPGQSLATERLNRGLNPCAWRDATQKRLFFLLAEARAEPAYMVMIRSQGRGEGVAGWRCAATKAARRLSPRLSHHILSRYASHKRLVPESCVAYCLSELEPGGAVNYGKETDLTTRIQYTPPRRNYSGSFRYGVGGVNQAKLGRLGEN